MGAVTACRRLKCLSLTPYYVVQMRRCTQKWDKRDDQGLVLNGGLAYGPYDINRIPLTSDPMPVVLLSDPKIQIPLS